MIPTDGGVRGGLLQSSGGSVLGADEGTGQFLARRALGTQQRRLLGKSAAQRIGILLNRTELGSQGYDALLVGALALLPAALQFGASARDGISCHLA